VEGAKAYPGQMAFHVVFVDEQQLPVENSQIQVGAGKAVELGMCNVEEDLCGFEVVLREGDNPGRAVGWLRLAKTAEEHGFENGACAR